jgi:hypothetical protein
MCLFFFLLLQQLLSFSNCVIFHKIKVAKHIWGTMLPPDKLATDFPSFSDLGSSSLALHCWYWKPTYFN